MAIDKKALVRAYKERIVPMGVYQVRNTITGHALVAASKDVRALLNRHKAQLSMNAHPSKTLQADWARHGAESFVFEVLDTFTPSDAPGYDPLVDLSALEDMWLDKLSLPIDPIHTIDPGRPAARAASKRG